MLTVVKFGIMYIFITCAYFVYSVNSSISLSFGLKENLCIVRIGLVVLYECPFEASGATGGRNWELLLREK